MWLYHATFRKNLKSIRETGLGGVHKKVWSFSLDNVVCLARNPDEAYDFCDTAEDVPDYIYNSGIIVFAIKSEDLEQNKICSDPNLRYVKSYIYKGIIPSNKLYVISDNKGLMGKLQDIKRVPSFYNIRNNFL